MARHRTHNVGYGTPARSTVTQRPLGGSMRQLHFILARLINSAPSRERMIRRPFLLIGQNVEMSIFPLIFAMRKLRRGSWKQAPRLFGSENALDADGHRCGAMRNLMFFRASDYLRKRMLED